MRIDRPNRKMALEGYFLYPRGYSWYPRGYFLYPRGYSWVPRGYFLSPWGMAGLPRGYVLSLRGYYLYPWGYFWVPGDIFDILLVRAAVWTLPESWAAGGREHGLDGWDTDLQDFECFASQSNNWFTRCLIHRIGMLANQNPVNPCLIRKIRVPSIRIP